MQNPASLKPNWKKIFKQKSRIVQKKQQLKQDSITAISQDLRSSSASQSSNKEVEEQNDANIEDIPKEALPEQNPSFLNQNNKLTYAKEIQQEKIDDSSLRQRYLLQPQVEQNEISQETKRIMSILESKDKVSKQRQIEEDNEKNQSENQSRESQSGQERNETTNKHATKRLRTGHYKIFNPQHFNVTKEQVNQVKQSTHRWTYGLGSTPNQLLISSWNVNGIRARMNANDIGPYLDFVKPDIFCINEHKMDQKSYLENPYKFWGYFSYWNFPKYSLGYSGVAVFSKYPAIKMWQDIHVAEHSKQGRVMTLQFDKFLLINVYIPTCGRELERLKYRVEEYDPAFREYVLDLQKKYPQKSVIICGDINVAHKQLDCHTGKRMLQGKQPAFTYQQRSSFTVFLRQAKMIDTFRHFYPDKREYTWWNMRRGGRQRNGQTGIGKRLDYFLVEEKSLKYVKSSEIKKQVKGCDHCPIQMKIDFSVV